MVDSVYRTWLWKCTSDVDSISYWPQVSQLVFNLTVWHAVIFISARWHFEHQLH